SPSDRPVSAIKIRSARSLSLEFRAETFVILFPETYPRRISVAVEIMLRTIFCAVPDLRRVEPAMTSGPTTGTMLTSASAVIADPGAQVIAAVKAPKERAYRTAPIV